jgi:hypothetical protein
MTLGQDTEDNIHRREELRGLFAVGVIAVLAAIEAAPEKFNIQDKQTFVLPFTQQIFTYHLFSFFNIVIFSWVGYAMIMVFAYSDDLVKSERARRVLKIIGLGFLLTGPFLFGVASMVVLTIAYIATYYPLSAYLLIAAFVVFIVTTSILAIHGHYSIKIERR